MSRSRLPLAIVLVVIVVGGLVAAALFKGAGSAKSTGTRSSAATLPSAPALGAAPAPQAGAVQPPGRGWICPRCRQLVDPGTAVCPHCGWYPGADVGSSPGAARPPTSLGPAGQQTGLLSPVQAGVAPGTPGPGGASSIPSPREQNAAFKEFIEGHWLGLEVIPLTPELATEYGIVPGDRGVLVDEITLESAESGILAGDMVHAIGNEPTPDLKQFFVAAQKVSRNASAPVEVSRRGTILTFTMQARNAAELGFAQMEAAQPIRPGSISPHRSLDQPCTNCHIIMASGGQLPTDMGDITPTPPPITTMAVPPHGNRGPCGTCHVIVR